MVRAGTEAECRAALAAVCASLGAEPAMEPTNRLGDGWIARAVKPAAPAGEGQGRR
jgi:hypothetical protein